MNTAVSSRVAILWGIAVARTPALQAFSRAWNTLSPRHWLIAAGIGLFFGVVYAAFNFLYFFKLFAESFHGVELSLVLANILQRWVILMTGVACALGFALGLLREVRRRTAIRPRDVALTILGVSAFGSLVMDPIAVGVIAAERHLWFQHVGGAFWDGVDWLTLLSRMYSQTGEKIVTFVATVTLAVVYYLKDLRTSDALAVTQLGLLQAQKRRLTEELRTAQAAVDPNFLFATLAEVDRRFDGDPLVARRLLDALIRYLRAALPAKDEAIGTLGQQATLVRAYLEIECIRSSGHLQSDVDVPSELEARLFAPALVVPLVALVAGDVACTARDARLHVAVALADGKLAVEVRSDGCQSWATAEQEATLASLRDRVHALYGSSAELSFAIRAPRGSTAKIVIDDPGVL